jgi:2-dehydropantoate 2-reductase
LTSEAPGAPATLVVGPGAIGLFVAARLSSRGAPVTLLARPGTGAPLREARVRLIDDGRKVVGDPAVIESAARMGDPGLVVVSVKSFDTAGVADDLAAHLAPDVPVLSLQNGVDNHEVLRRALPRNPVGAAAVYLGCQRTGPGRVVRRPSRDPATGRLRDRLAGGGPPPLPDLLRRLGDALGVPVEAATDPRPALWTKLVANASLNTVTALGRARVGRAFGDPEARDLMRRIGAEVVAVARAEGVALPSDAGDSYVADAARRLPADGGSSTLFDLEAGRRLERDALIGAVAARGLRAGVPVPVSRACAALLELADPWQDAPPPPA